MTHMIDVRTTGEARDGFADLIERAQLGLPTEITNRGKRAAVVVPPEVWDQYLKYAKRDLEGLIKEREDDGTQPLTEVLKDVVAETTK